MVVTAQLLDRSPSVMHICVSLELYPSQVSIPGYCHVVRPTIVRKRVSIRQVYVKVGQAAAGCGLLPTVL